MAFALAGVSGIVGGVSGALSDAAGFIGGLFGGVSKDPERLGKNAAAYDLALSGHAAALDFLKARSGRFGLLPVGVVPGVNLTANATLGGWGTELARDDAYARYQDAVNRLAGGAVTPSTPGAGAFGPSTTLVPAGTGSGSDLLLWVALGAAAVFLFRKGPR